MSKAFDTVDRTIILLKDLSNVANNDELHLITIMLYTAGTVWGNEESESSKADIDIPQREGLSANESTLT